MTFKAKSIRMKITKLKKKKNVMLETNPLKP